MSINSRQSYIPLAAVVLVLCSFVSLKPTSVELSIVAPLMPANKNSARLVPTATAGEGFDVVVLVSEDGQEVPQNRRTRTSSSFTFSTNVAPSNDLIIEGIDNFSHYGPRYQEQKFVEQGREVKRMTYTYTFIGSATGLHTIGPVTLPTGEKSNALEVNIVSEAQQATKSAKNQGPKQMLKLSLNRSMAVIGEEVLLTVAIWDREGIAQLQLDEPKIEGATLEPVHRDYVRSKQSAHAQLYDVYEQQYRVRSLSTGRKLIGPITGYLGVQEKRPTRQTSRFSLMFGPQLKQKKIKSNSLYLTIEDLPEHAGRVDAVGQFKLYNLGLNKTRTYAHEPVTLIVTIEGEGDLDHLDEPQLDLPAAFRTYLSRSNVIPGTNGGMRKKKFEYVLTVDEEGDWEVEPQKFVYYDTGSRSYKTLESNLLRLEVKPSRETLADRPRDQKGEPKIEETQLIPPVPKRELAFIELQGPLHAKDSRTFPWWLFILLLIIPCIPYFPSLLSGLSMFMPTWLSHWIEQRRRASAAKKELEKLVKKGDVSGIYRVFDELVASLTAKGDKTVLLKSSFSKLSEDYNGFSNFLDGCSRAAFSVKKLDENQKNRLLSEASKWLDVVIKIIQSSI